MAIRSCVLLGLCAFFFFFFLPKEPVLGGQSAACEGRDTASMRQLKVGTAGLCPASGAWARG